MNSLERQLHRIAHRQRVQESLDRRGEDRAWLLREQEAELAKTLGIEAYTEQLCARVETAMNDSETLRLVPELHSVRV